MRLSKWRLGKWRLGKWRLGKWRLGKWRLGKWRLGVGTCFLPMLGMIKALDPSDVSELPTVADANGSAGIRGAKLVDRLAVGPSLEKHLHEHCGNDSSDKPCGEYPAHEKPTP